MGELRAGAVSEVHVIVPEGIDDPARPSGGNTYDRRVCAGSRALGWVVHEHAVGRATSRAIARGEIPDGAVVLLDGLIASPAPEVLVPEAGRLRQVVLMHMPIGDAREREVSRRRPRVDDQRVDPAAPGRAVRAGGAVHVAEPGVDAAGLAPGPRPATSCCASRP